MWPDWTIFGNLFPIPQRLATFRVFLKKYTLCKNCSATIWSTFGNIFTPTSGHTASISVLDGKKPLWYYLVNLWKHLGYFFTPTSGHTASISLLDGKNCFTTFWSTFGLLFYSNIWSHCLHIIAWVGKTAKKLFAFLKKKIFLPVLGRRWNFLIYLRRWMEQLIIPLSVFQQFYKDLTIII